MTVKQVGHIVVASPTSSPLSTAADGAGSPKRKKTTKSSTAPPPALKLTSELITKAALAALGDEGEKPSGVSVQVSAGGGSASFSFDASPMSNGTVPALPPAVDINGTSLTVFIEEQATTTQQQQQSFVSGPTKPLTASRLIFDSVFVVGAGGIGCEILKDLVLYGFRNIEIIDLDTIDASNLNRQFLFRKHHVGEPKSVVAKETVMSWFNEQQRSGEDGTLKILARHGNVKDAEYDVDFYKRFALVMNGLDNMSARKHVNRMCMLANVPLCESGTMGYNGQVQPIIKDVFQCYDCHPKPADQKTFPVCTIHARPTSMVHCVHYAKEIYGRLFGDVVVVPSEGQDGEKEGGDDDKNQKSDMAFLDDSPESRSNPEKLFTLLFQTKVEELLSLKTEWTIKPPVPITVADCSTENGGDQTVASDVIPNLAQLLHQFCQHASQCAGRDRTPFSKSDPIACNFIAALANLRAHCFHITKQSTTDVVTIAGSIVPAIASTNATIAACLVAQAINILDGKTDKDGLRLVYLRKAPQTRRRKYIDPVTGNKKTVADQSLLHSLPPDAPNPNCLVCSGAQRPVSVKINASLHTLGSFVQRLLVGQLSFGAPIVSAGPNTIYEHEDFESLVDAQLSRWVNTAAGSPATQLIVGDLNQTVEWTMSITHDEKECTDVSHFQVDGMGSTEATDPTAKGSAAAKDTTVSGADGAAAPSNTNEVIVAANVEEDDDEVVAYHPKRQAGGSPSRAAATTATTKAMDEVIDISDDE